MNINVEYLEGFRKDAFLTIEQTAAQAEISQTTYRKIVQGGDVSPRIILKLIEKLKLDKEKLIKGG